MNWNSSLRSPCTQTKSQLQIRPDESSRIPHTDAAQLLPVKQCRQQFTVLSINFLDFVCRSHERDVIPAVIAPDKLREEPARLRRRSVRALNLDSVKLSGLISLIVFSTRRDSSSELSPADNTTTFPSFTESRMQRIFSIEVSSSVRALLNTST